jgi:hypothetical protein
MLLALTSTAPKPVLIAGAPEGTTRNDARNPTYSAAPRANGLPSTAERAAESRIGTLAGNSGNSGISVNTLILAAVSGALIWALFFKE